MSGPFVKFYFSFQFHGSTPSSSILLEIQFLLDVILDPIEKNGVQFLARGGLGFLRLHFRKLAL